MTYKELIKELYDMVRKHHKDWSIKESQKSAIHFAHILTENDKDDAKFLDAGICPKCFTPGWLINESADHITCLECGEGYIRIS